MTTYANSPRRRPAEHGAALVIGLLLLLVLTILAISGMTTASLELQMAGNEQYQERAFQAAEAGIERAIATGDYSTTGTVGDFTTPADPDERPEPIAGEGVPGCTASIDSGADADKDQASTDCYEYFMRFDSQSGSTPVPGGGYSLGTGFEAYHFVVHSIGESSRGAASEHEQSFYIVGPGGT